MNTTRARQHYLDNLVDNHDELDSDEDDRVCILCRCDFTRGYITQWYETVFISPSNFFSEATLLLQTTAPIHSVK